MILSFLRFVFVDTGMATIHAEMLIPVKTGAFVHRFIIYVKET